jgi:hypothetical protein
MASKSNKDNMSLEDLGLETTNVSSPEQSPIDRAAESLQKAATAVALKAAIEADTELAVKEAEKSYIIEKKRYMLEKCKKDRVVKFVGQKIFANYFGPKYTFLYNGIPVTVLFDGSTQEFPEFIYNKIMDMISAVSESNTNKVEIEDRTA